MPDVIDNLQIEIGGKADNANKAIDNLVIKLDRLTTSISGLNKANFTGFSVGVKNVSNAMQGLSNVKLPDYTRLAKGIEKFSTINAGQIQSAGMAMQELGKSLRMIDGVNVSDNATQLASLAKGISQLGYKSATQAVQNIPKLATAMRDLMKTLSTAPRVSQNIIDMTNALAKLARTGASSGRASTSLAKSLDLYTASTHRASKGTWSLASAFGKMYASYWLLFRAFSKIGDAIDISSDLTEIQNVVDVTFGDMTHKVEQFAETSIEQFGMSELTLKKVASQFQAMGSAMNISNKSIANANEYLNKQTDGYVELGNSMADVSLTLTKLTADMASFYNVEQDVVAEDLQAIFTAQSKPLRDYGIDLTEVNLKQWAMTQGLNSNIDAMTQAEKTMLRYQYVLAHTGASQNDFQRTSMSYANTLRILKQNFQQLGAIIGGTFINMLKPLMQALNNAMSGIIAFAQTVSNALGKIFGWQYEVGNGGVTSDLESGADYADDLSDSMGSASDNAKKLKSYLLGIDELNVLEPQQDTSGSGGSGAGAGAGGGGASGGQWVKTDGLFADYESEIDNLFELGRYISETLSEAMESIDWESVYEKARGFGTGLAQFLNGLITPRLFGNLGTTIANSINTAFEAVNAFSIEFNWKNLGTSIATGIDNFFENWDAKLSSKALSNFTRGILQSLSSFIGTLKDKNTFKDMGQNIVDFVVGIEWGGLIWDLSNFLTELSTALVKFPADFGLGIAEAIWEEISGQEITLEMPKWLEGLGDIMLTWISPQLGAINISSKIQEALFGSGEHQTSNSTTKGGSGTSRGQDTSTFTQDLEKAKEEFNQFFVDIGIYSTNFFDNLYANKLQEFVTNTYEKFSEWYENSVKPWFTSERWEELWGNIKNSAETKWNELILWWNETALVKWWKDDVSPWFTAEKWTELYSTIKTSLENTWTLIKSWWAESALYRWYNDDVKPWFDSEKWTVLYDTIKKELQNKWDELVRWWTTSGIYRWYNDNVKPWFAKDKWTFSGIKDGLVSAWESAVEGVKAVWNKFATWFNSKMKLELPDLEIGGTKVFEGTTVEFIQLPTFATGGFPEDGLFMANHGELVGKFSNGRTAVANNEMITKGIEEAVYRGFSMAYSENTREASLLEELIVAVREGKEITIDGRSLVEAYDSRKTRNGYAF